MNYLNRTEILTRASQRKMDIRDQFLDIQLCDKHLRNSFAISKILILPFVNIFDIKAEYSDTRIHYIYILQVDI